MRIKIKLNRVLLTLAFAAQATCLFAQQAFKYQAAIKPVDTPAFYRINLPTAVLAKSSADLADIRVLDQRGKFVPYVFGSQLPVKTQQNFIAFPQIKGVSQPDTITAFVAENNNGLTINQLILKLRNTSVNRIVNLSGSDDLANWYAIKENILLNKAGSEGNNNGIYEQLLNFPASKYHYFKVAINNNRKDAVAILQAGIYQMQSVKAAYTQLPGVKYIQKDSDKVSRLFITFNEAYPVNKLQLAIKGAKYYKRAIGIYALNGEKRQLLNNTVITSAGNSALYIAARTKGLMLEVTNDDNPPLIISAVTAYHLDQSLVAYLDKGDNYKLLFGDTAATTPVYDLQFFTDSLQRDLSVVQVGNVTANQAYQHNSAIAKSQVPSWLIWAAIIAVIALLTFLTIKMTREVTARRSEE